MHAHGTAVLDRTAEATLLRTKGASARDRWLAKCQADLAEALATGNAHLLPLTAEVAFAAAPDLCGDCQGTGYYDDTLDLCCCMAGQHPAYDYPRYVPGEVIEIIGMRRTRRDGSADTWKSCQHCNIPPIKDGPYDLHDLDAPALRVPWEPDCPACQDTGWVHARHIALHPALARSGR